MQRLVGPYIVGVGNIRAVIEQYCHHIGVALKRRGNQSRHSAFVRAVDRFQPSIEQVLAAVRLPSAGGQNQSRIAASHNVGGVVWVRLFVALCNIANESKFCTTKYKRAREGSSKALFKKPTSKLSRNNESRGSPDI